MKFLDGVKSNLLLMIFGLTATPLLQISYKNWEFYFFLLIIFFCNEIRDMQTIKNYRS